MPGWSSPYKEIEVKWKVEKQFFVTFLLNTIQYEIDESKSTTKPE